MLIRIKPSDHCAQGIMPVFYKVAAGQLVIEVIAEPGAHWCPF